MSDQQRQERKPGRRPGRTEWKKTVWDGVTVEVLEGWPPDLRYPYTSIQQERLQRERSNDEDS